MTKVGTTPNLDIEFVHIVRFVIVWLATKRAFFENDVGGCGSRIGRSDLTDLVRAVVQNRLGCDIQCVVKTTNKHLGATLYLWQMIMKLILPVKRVRRQWLNRWMLRNRICHR